MVHDLRPLSNINKLFKFADDTTCLSPSNTDLDLNQELQHILEWADSNKMKINLAKSKELVFHRPHPTKFAIPEPLSNIEQVMEAKLLGVIFKPNFDFTAHVETILTICSQRTYLLKILRERGMPGEQLKLVFQALIASKINYAISAWGGFASKAVIDRVDVFSRKCKKWKFSNSYNTFEFMLQKADKSLFKRICQPSHCLHALLPPTRSSDEHNLRQRGHNFYLPDFIYKLHKNSFFCRVLYSYV